MLILRFVTSIIFLFFSGTSVGQVLFDRNIPFDQDWKFFRGGIQDGETLSLNDSNWRILDLPHDWSIENLPGQSSPFDPDAVSQVGGGFTTGGTAWYRKRFFMEKNVNNQQVEISFEGIYMNADIWVNGKHVGYHPNGYSGFWYNITSFLKFNSINLIAVEVKNEGQNSRWYSGSGIYRHVWLHRIPSVHFKEWGVYVRADILKSQKAKIKINTQIVNSVESSGKFLLQTTLFDRRGKKIKSGTTNVQSGLENTVYQEFVIEKPEKWTLDQPYLYRLQSEIYKNSILQDRVITKIGIREISVDTVNGFMLNAVSLKLKGACIHQDHGPLGSASFDRAEERRVRLLKQNGFNAVRCAHNPPAPAFLDFCDSLGMLVVDESFDMWSDQKNPFDYHLYFRDYWQRDMEDMVLRDRNHPSLIMWSIGNEIPHKESTRVVQQALDLAAVVRTLDSGRLITAAVNEMEPDKDPFFKVLDIAGYNYGVNRYETDHIRKPDRLIMGTESYPLEAFDYWTAVENNPFIIGDFVWTGFDYIGEASIGWRGYWQQKDFYPWNLAYCGDLDICGWKRPQSFYRDALWKKNQLSIFVQPPLPSFPLNPKKESWSKWNWEDVVADWNWNPVTDTAVEVKIYSSCEQVELFINGKSLGRKITGDSTRFLANWKVKFVPGILEAVGYSSGKIVNRQSLATAGPASKIKLTSDRKEILSGGQDLCYVDIEVLDTGNHLLPKFEKQLTFTISGPAAIAGVGNGNPISLEGYQQQERNAWRGRCLAIIKSTHQKGLVTLTVRAEGLPPVELDITSR